VRPQDKREANGMTSSDAPTGKQDNVEDDQGEDDVSLRVALSRLDAEIAELMREIHGLRAQLNDEGPMDDFDRTSIITQAEELEAFQDELEARRERLREKLGKGSS
jgi:multidrug resistance efflux pump